MLVLTRKLLEQIRIGDDIVVTVVRVQGNTVRLGIEAPRDTRIVRGELPRFEDSPSTGAANASAPIDAPPTNASSNGSPPTSEQPEVLAATLRVTRPRAAQSRQSRGTTRTMPLSAFVASVQGRE